MAATDLPGDEREVMGGHMDDYFGPRVTDAAAEGTCQLPPYEWGGLDLES